MSYQPGVYRKQGGNELVVASTTSGPNSGKITIEAASGGIQVPVQTLTSTETGTNLTGHGLSVLGASTTGPTYTIPAPAAAGLVKYISITAATSAASNVVVAAATTDISVGVTGDNQITITSTGTGAGVTLVSESVTAWRMMGGSSLITAAQST